MPKRSTRRQSTIVHHSWEKKFHDFGCDGGRLQFRALSRRIAPGGSASLLPGAGSNGVQEATWYTTPGLIRSPLLLPAMAWCHRWIIVGRKNWAPACKWGLRYAMRSTNRHSDVTRDSNNEGASESQRDAANETTRGDLPSLRLRAIWRHHSGLPPSVWGSHACSGRVNPTINWYLWALRMTENILVDSY